LQDVADVKENLKPVLGRPQELQISLCGRIHPFRKKTQEILGHAQLFRQPVAAEAWL
jgi:hypothetical protein